jgi:hypothetical protein
MPPQRYKVSVYDNSCFSPELSHLLTGTESAAIMLRLSGSAIQEWCFGGWKISEGCCGAVPLKIT